MLMCVKSDILFILVRCSYFLTHRCGGVSESVLCPVLLERLSIDNMRLLDCELPFLTSVVSDKENLISIRDQSQDILHKIISVISG